MLADPTDVTGANVANNVTLVNGTTAATNDDTAMVDILSLTEELEILQSTAPVETGQIQVVLTLGTAADSSSAPEEKFEETITIDIGRWRIRY